MGSNNLPFIYDFLIDFGIYVGYICACAVILLIVRYTCKVPDYIFRKLMHTVAFTSILPLVFGTQNAWTAVAVEFVFLVLAVCALLIAERFSFYSGLFVEKGKHEVVISFFMSFGLVTILLAIFWGWLDRCYIVVASIMAWGFGDGMAAVVGKRFGTHKLQGAHIEGVKSIEGSVAMAVASFVSALVVLIFMSPLPWYMSLVFSFILAPACSLTELFTKKGLDTVTVPIVASLILCFTMFW